MSILDDEDVAIGSYAPFFKYAVLSSNKSCVGIPFYTYKGALRFAMEAHKVCPWSTHQIVKRRLFSRTVDTVEIFLKTSDL